MADAAAIRDPRSAGYAGASDEVGPPPASGESGGRSGGKGKKGGKGRSSGKGGSSSSGITTVEPHPKTHAFVACVGEDTASEPVEEAAWRKAAALCVGEQTIARGGTRYSFRVTTQPQPEEGEAAPALKPYKQRTAVSRTSAKPYASVVRTVQDAERLLYERLGFDCYTLFFTQAYCKEGGDHEGAAPSIKGVVGVYKYHNTHDLNDRLLASGSSVSAESLSRALNNVDVAAAFNPDIKADPAAPGPFLERLAALVAGGTVARVEGGSVVHQLKAASVAGVSSSVDVELEQDASAEHGFTVSAVTPAAKRKGSAERTLECECLRSGNAAAACRLRFGPSSDKKAAALEAGAFDGVSVTAAGVLVAPVQLAVTSNAYRVKDSTPTEAEPFLGRYSYGSVRVVVSKVTQHEGRTSSFYYCEASCPAATAFLSQLPARYQEFVRAQPEGDEAAFFTEQIRAFCKLVCGFVCELVFLLGWGAASAGCADASRALSAEEEAALFDALIHKRLETVKKAESAADFWAKAFDEADEAENDKEKKADDKDAKAAPPAVSTAQAPPAEEGV
eukprot:Rhum_TRINITY_DN22934_c0_g1::Rhum_TRINITY_DN22934_c0_g1_i1::g.176409::m.176409